MCRSSADLIITREIAALWAHVSTYENFRQNLDMVATKVNENPHMVQKVNFKDVQDRYKRLQEVFDSDDARKATSPVW